MAILSRNLIENAIKFTPEQGEVSIRLTKAEHEVLLEVTDNGEGIPDDHKPKVFDRFYRVLKTKTDGSGLGLSMVKWIVDHYGANITLQDNSPQGLRIVVSFPENLPPPSDSLQHSLIL